MSATPPAGKLTMMRTGLDGYGCAAANDDRMAASTASSARRIGRFSLAASLAELKALEAVQLFLDPPPALGTRAFRHPGPFLHAQPAARALGLEVDHGHDLVAVEHRLREIAEHALLLRHVGLEAVLVAEKQLQP